jgi:hypothetical protein
LGHVLKAGDGAAKTHEAVSQENLDGLGVCLHDVANGHLFRNRFFLRFCTHVVLPFLELFV